jgi:uncharacterized ferritin-like protein (DUF455 family)
VTSNAIIIVDSTAELARLIAAAHEIWYFEQALAHLLSGWVPKLREYEQKKACAHFVFRSATTAQNLERSLGAFESATTLRHNVPMEWVGAMEGLDRSISAEALFESMLVDLQPHLEDRYRLALGLADEILHESLHAALQAGQRAHETRSRQLAQWLPKGPRRDRNNHAFAGRNDGSATHAAHILWEPIDRVPIPARPEGTKYQIEGSMRPLPLDGLRDPAGIGMILHNNINGEYTTFELMLRCRYEHPNMPAAFHADLARHAADEARHAEAMERMAERCGTRYGDHPVFISSYELNYEFEPCIAGGRDELLWRLLLRATVQEGESLDDLAFQARKRTFLGQSDLADMFAAILADEIFHVRSGLKWSRFLCEQLGRNEVEERSLANEWYNNRLVLRRAAFVQQNPEVAANERDYAIRRRAYQQAAGVFLPFEMEFNQPTREFAGFSPIDIEQARRWGERRR